MEFCEDREYVDMQLFLTFEFWGGVGGIEFRCQVKRVVDGSTLKCDERDEEGEAYKGWNILSRGVNVWREVELY